MPRRFIDRARCKAQRKLIEQNLGRAIDSANSRGYTAMVRSKGSVFDDPKVKLLMRKYDALIKKC